MWARKSRISRRKYININLLLIIIWLLSMDLIKSTFLGINKPNVIIVIGLRKFRLIVIVRKFSIARKNVKLKISLIIKMCVNLFMVQVIWSNYDWFMYCKSNLTYIFLFYRYLILNRRVNKASLSALSKTNLFEIKTILFTPFLY